MVLIVTGGNWRSEEETIFWQINGSFQVLNV